MVKIKIFWWPSKEALHLKAYLLKLSSASSPRARGTRDVLGICIKVLVFVANSDFWGFMIHVNTVMRNTKFSGIAVWPERGIIPQFWLPEHWSYPGTQLPAGPLALGRMGEVPHWKEANVRLPGGPEPCSLTITTFQGSSKDAFFGA